MPKNPERNMNRAPMERAPEFKLSSRRGIWYATWTERRRSRRVSLGTTDERVARLKLRDLRPVALVPAPGRPARLYVIGNEANNLVKIGVAVHEAAGRLQILQTGSPVRLMVLREFDCPDLRTARFHETRLHFNLASKRAHGEWFEATVEEIDAIMVL